jgi:hypothetical protein
LLESRSVFVLAGDDDGGGGASATRKEETVSTEPREEMIAVGGIEDVHPLQVRGTFECS